MKSFTLALLLAFVSVQTIAAEPSPYAPSTIGLHIATKHNQPGYNSANPGLYAKWDSGLTVGFYRNSESNRFGNPTKISTYVGYTAELPAFDLGSYDLRIGATVGVITGYGNRRLTPLLAPSVAISKGANALRLTVIPSFRDSAAGIHLSIEHHF